MGTVFARTWKSLACRGAIAIAFGLIALVRPGMTLAALVLLFGGYALLDGFLSIAVGTRHRAREHAWTMALEGFAGIGLGLAALLWTRTAAELIVILIALWAIGTGILDLFATIRLRRELPGEVLLGIAGTVSVLLGFAILFWPRAGTFALVTLLGSYALVFGTAMLLQGLRLRRVLRRFEEGDGHIGPTPRVV